MRQTNRRLPARSSSKSLGRQPIGFSILLFGFAGQKVHPAIRKSCRYFACGCLCGLRKERIFAGRGLRAHESSITKSVPRGLTPTKTVSERQNYHNRYSKHLAKR